MASTTKLKIGDRVRVSEYYPFVAELRGKIGVVAHNSPDFLSGIRFRNWHYGHDLTAKVRTRALTAVGTSSRAISYPSRRGRARRRARKQSKTVKFCCSFTFHNISPKPVVSGDLLQSIVRCSEVPMKCIPWVDVLSFAQTCNLCEVL